LEIVPASSFEVNAYLRFIRSLYKGNPHYRATLHPTMSRMLSGKLDFCSGKLIEPILIREGAIRAVGTLIWTDKAPDTLQLAFLEFNEDADALSLLVDTARERGKTLGAKKIVMGVNGHPNYGLGILSAGFEHDMSFGNAWNFPYYDVLLSQVSDDTYELHTYLLELSRYDSYLKPRSGGKLRIRPMDLNRLGEESRVYNRISNAAFQSHPFYFPPSEAEDLELLSMLKPLLKPEHILFAEVDGETVGYVLWYPDFNELVPPGRTFSLLPYLKLRSGLFPVSSYRGAQVAILPEHQRSGVGISLMAACYQHAKKDFKFCETGWVIGSNTGSKGMIDKWNQETVKPHKSYKVYTVSI